MQKKPSTGFPRAKPSTKPVSQDFFPRSASATAAKTQGFLFNQAPLNKNKAKEEYKEKVATSSQKRSAFVARLYQDDDVDQLEKRASKYDQEMKVFDMDGDSDTEKKMLSTKKRDIKVQDKEKSDKPIRKMKSVDASSRIGKLKLNNGCLGLFAISEIHPTYFIVNFTRNTKGFIALAEKGQEEPHKKFEIGQYVIAQVQSVGTSQFNVQTSGTQNRKIQLVLANDTINKSLKVDNIVPNMQLQGEIESKEAKGFLINFGLKDKSKGFLAFDQDTEHLVIGQILSVAVKSVLASSKIIKCELATKEAAYKYPLNSKELTIHNLKPGFLVNSKVSRTLENGIELSFLGGFNGTVFVDHLDKGDPNKYKIGEKHSARIVSVDPQSQIITLSLLPHLLKFENISSHLTQQGVSIGQVFEKVPVTQVAFGDSYKIGVTPTVNGFLHKIHAVKKQKENKKVLDEEEDDENRPVYTMIDLEKGQKVDKIRVKEINYFDGCPILSMREDIVATEALSYNFLKSGMYLTATIEEVDPQSKFIVLNVNEFVKGRLYIEHMADLPLKVLPPKLTKVGKQIKVRVFYIDKKSRYLEFTKKETLFKEKTPVYQSYKDAQKGSKIVGVVVDQNEYGYIIKSFGGIKGLLTFADIKQNGKQSAKELKIGNIVKAYVLFRKKDKGMALTQDKAKAKELRKLNDKEEQASTSNGQNVQQKRLEEYYPTAEQLSELKEKYKSLIKISQDKNNIGKVLQFRVVETNESFFICKSLDADKKSKNIIAVLPKPLVNKFHLPSLTLEDYVFDCLVLEIPEDSLPILSSQQDLIQLIKSIPRTSDDLTTIISPVGIISSVDRKGVTLRFQDGLCKLVLVKDLETVNDFISLYRVGHVVRASKNLLDRLTLKHSVIYHQQHAGDLQLTDKEAQIRGLFKELSGQHQIYNLKVGERVEAQISLVKDYGNIVSILKYPGLTGFILSEQLIGKKEYKEGQIIKCVVMDIDFEKEILDLSEKLADAKEQKQQHEIKVGHSYKATVELNKEDYLLISFKQSRNSIGICMMQAFNNDQSPNPNEKYQMGDEVDVKILEHTSNGLILTIPTPVSQKDQKSLSKKQKLESANLSQGQIVHGQIKSIKGFCLYVQLSGMDRLTIARLHRLECQSGAEFEGFSISENINAKILKVSQGRSLSFYSLNIHLDKDKTWIELTRRKEHLSKHGNYLDGTALQKTHFSLEDFKSGEQYDALITDVNYAYSQPLNLSISPFIKTYVSFDQIVDPTTLSTEGPSYLQKFKVGTSVKAWYINGQFSLIKNQGKTSEQKINKGDVRVVRYVKGVTGKGVTVQITPNLYGFIEMAEITDDLIGSVLDNLSLIQPLFVARVIAFDKNQKPLLSSRESVVQDKSWQFISPQGKSVHFQKYDEKHQLFGNQRNKILKYGPDVALHEDDLCLGYISNIGKSGCFVQIGHNCSVRAGLNELSDKEGFQFTEQMPLGRMVLGRIYKVEEVNGKKRFNVTLRKSLLVYGTNVVSRDSLTEGAQVPCIVIAIVEEGSKAFAQIKGSYLKVKVKGLKPGMITSGDNINVKLTKVTKQKITGIFENKSPKTPLDDKEKRIEKLWESIEEEAQKDIITMKKRVAAGEIDQEKLKDLGQREEAEDEVERQYRDLMELQKDDEDMETVQDDDSDAEEMQRIIKESKIYEDEDDNDDDDDDQEENDDDEELEDEQEDEDGHEMKFNESSDDGEEESKVTKKTSGKQSLKARVKEEQEIRTKEKNMRNNTDQPTNIDDFERLVVANQDQSYVWIQYMAFMLDNLGADAARRIAERAVKSVSISNEEDKFNLWIAFMNLENNFGTQQTLESVVKRALEVNDRKKIYLQLITMYQSANKYQYIEDIYKQLSKKFNTSLKVWSGFLEFLFQVRQYKKDRSSPQHVVVSNLDTSEPKQVLQRALQSLQKDKHVNLISKFGMLEFKHGAPENGRTMFEGIVNNYPKRMDIWSIYMDMEVKYGGGGAQTRHLFERCLNNDFIQKKPKKMKLVFQKYMEFEMQHGNKKNVEKLRQRVEEYLEKAFSGDKNKRESSDEDME